MTAIILEELDYRLAMAPSWLWPKTIGWRLKRSMRHADFGGIGVRDLAAVEGISATQVSMVTGASPDDADLESRLSRMGRNRLISIARRLRVNSDWLITGECPDEHEISEENDPRPKWLRDAADRVQIANWVQNVMDDCERGAHALDYPNWGGSLWPSDPNEPGNIKGEWIAAIALLKSDALNMIIKCAQRYARDEFAQNPIAGNKRLALRNCQNGARENVIGLPEQIEQVIDFISDISAAWKWVRQISEDHESESIDIAMSRRGWRMVARILRDREKPISNMKSKEHVDRLLSNIDGLDGNIESLIGKRSRNGAGMKYTTRDRVIAK